MRSPRSAPTARRPPPRWPDSWRAGSSGCPSNTGERGASAPQWRTPRGAHAPRSPVLEEVMDHFQYKDRVLHCEDVPVADLAEKYGTPLFVYSQATLLHHLTQ